ncbi:hypothetical protein GCM10007972_05690 [Iodidimonas muriae]|uniref:Uncharacterized protein n=1 Tax=Iodidimonas muriae TaxID=261467 RepID=A0ABQ2L8N6_9PROT|nr:hypothetical protein JCM17843_01070 [Kordiimonadales bacterium JCM 17843]GGO06926.1 hypothetical protein GCM10007972_05690 [Iodidimonas muriae]
MFSFAALLLIGSFLRGTGLRCVIVALGFIFVSIFCQSLDGALVVIHAGLVLNWF